MSEEIVNYTHELEAHDGFSPGERPKRLARLLDIIEQYVSSGVIEAEDGGWAKVSAEDTRLLHAIFGEIIDLKVARDGDGDATLNVYIEDRQQGRMHIVHEPNTAYEPNNIEENTRQIGELVRAASLHSNYASDIMNKVTRIQSSVNEDMRIERETLAKIDEFEERFKAGLSVDLMMDWHNFCRDNRKRGNRVAENMKMVRVRNSERFPDILASQIDQIMELMSHFQTDDQDNFYTIVVEPRMRLSDVFGNAFIGAVESRAKELNEAGRAIRAHKKLVSRGRVKSVIN